MTDPARRQSPAPDEPQGADETASPRSPAVREEFQAPAVSVDAAQKRSDPTVQLGPSRDAVPAPPVPAPAEASPASASLIADTRVTRAPTTGIRPGDLVLEGRFRILELLGRGGMGDVFLAEQLSLGRKVALKLLREEFSAQPGIVERFRREARLLSVVDDPSVVRIIDFGESHGAFCLVMEYAEGELLAVTARSGPMPVERALRVLRQIASGLEVIHAAGIVHRDLKPENIVLSQGPRGEQARLLDFGIARLIESDEQGPSVTRAGLVLGTPEYMSPEQALGKAPDARTDIYAFGVVAYRLLTGTLPFSGPSAREYLLQHVATPPPLLERTVPTLASHRGLCELVAACLDKEPTRRPADGRALGAKLDALTAASPAPVRPEPSPVDEVQKARRSGFNVRRVASIGAAVAVCVGIIATWISSVDWTARWAREELLDGRPSAALARLEAAAKTPARQFAKLAALHALQRHRDEWALVITMDRGVLEDVDEEVLVGLAADYAENERDETLRSAVVRLPEAAQQRLEDLAEGPLSPAQWGALRILDLARAQNVDLVDLYIHALSSEECELLAVAASRLGELGDEDAIGPLEEVRARPRPRGFLFFDKSCGHNEAGAAISRLKAPQRR